MADRYSALTTAATVLTTELNSLASAALCTVSSAQSNDAATTERFPKCMVEIYLAAQGTNRVAGAYVALYFVPTIDTTNFGDTNDETAENYFVATASLDDASLAARRVTLYNLPLPPSDYKVALRNGTGQTFAASGNTVKVSTYTRENV